MLSRRALIQGLLLASSGCGRVPLGPPEKPPLPPTPEVDRRERLEARLSPFMAGTPGSGVAVVMVDSAGSEALTFGRSGYHDAHPPRADSLFELGGLGEVLLGLALAEMVGRDRVRLDSPVNPLLPESLRLHDGDSITLADLALHSAGLPTLSGDPARQSPANEEQMAKLLGSVKRSPVSSARLERSAIGTELLAHALSIKEGHPFGALLFERILSPWGLTTTGTFDRTGAFEDRLVEGFDANGAPVPARFEQPLFGAPFAIRSSPNDVAQLLSSLVGAKRSPLAAPTLLPRRVFDDESEVALGWRVERGRARYFQAGWSSGFSSAFFLEPALSRAFAVLVASSTVDAVALGRELMRELSLPSGPTPLPDRSVVPALPPNTVRAQADFGRLFRLVGYSLDTQVVRAGGDARVTLYWQCLDRVRQDFEVIVYGEDSTRRASLRADHYPAQGRFPTFDWHVGDIVSDTFNVHVPRTYAGANVTLWLAFGAAGKTLKADPGPVVDLAGRARGPSLEVVR